ncbi:uncharacterized protein LOC118187030 [Stegodyphus dumicola]|uniref:uncharacterized protein LOC118187030 n=1 Tax=Stegodyphus dumicola TaxID=202533 RepID=UPI0015A95560|nr:uncharacterized protein LOC118187030 [Stegodyphus dumicola]
MWEDMSYRSRSIGYRTKKWNDLEWELHLEQPAKSSRSRTARWQCGDNKKLKKLISNFSKNSSAHGTAYICDSSSGTSKFMKIVYKVLFVLCLMNVVGSIVFLLQESLSKESIYINSINKDSVAGMVEDPDYFPHYPRVTICRRPSYRTDLNSSLLQLLEYANIALGFPFSGLTPKEISDLILVARHRINANRGRLPPDVVDFQETLDNLQIEYDKYKNSTEDFNLKNFVNDNSYKCNEIFIDCVALVLKMNCCEVFLPSLTPLGLCYEMVLDEQILQTMANAKVHFTLSIDLKNPPHIDRPLEEGFLVGFSDPNAEGTGAMIQDVEMAIPNYLTYLKVKLIRTERNALHTAWHGLTESCPSMPEFEDMNSTYGNRYSLQTCDIHYLMSIFVKYCECQAVVFPGNTTRRLCDPADIYHCVLVAYAKDNRK